MFSLNSVVCCVIAPTNFHAIEYWGWTLFYVSAPCHMLYCICCKGCAIYDWCWLALKPKRYLSTLGVFSDRAGNKIKMRRGPWYLQCDHARPVCSAMKRRVCDEKQGEYIKAEPFCKSLPFSFCTCLLGEPRCHVNKEGKGRRMIALEGERQWGRERVKGRDRGKRLEKMSEYMYCRKSKWDLVRNERRHIERREEDRLGLR